MKNVIVVIGAGSIGQAVARRVSAGKHLLLADLRHDNADAAAKTLADAGFDASTANVDVSSRASVRALVEKATSIGEIAGLIHAAGVSPSQASPQTNSQSRSVRNRARVGRIRQRHRARRCGRRDCVPVSDGAFITGSDFLMDGGVTAAYWFGELAPE